MSGHKPHAAEQDRHAGGIEGQRGGQCEPGGPGVLGAAPEGALMTGVLSQLHSYDVPLRTDSHVSICITIPSPLKTHRTSTDEETSDSR